jgi:hypothetical protein
LKLQNDVQFSNFAFKFNLRRYSMALLVRAGAFTADGDEGRGLHSLVPFSAQPEPFMTQNTPKPTPDTA